jgi:TRAP-type C4-dicarboxylate transport system permease small subunit
MTEERRTHVLSRIERLADSVAAVTDVGCVVFGAAMVAIVVAGVFTRYIMQNPLVWTEALARMAMIWTAYLGMSIAVKRQGHLGVTIMVRKLPLPGRRLVKLFTDLLIAAFLSILIVKGIKMVAVSGIQIEPATGITMSYPFSIIPLSGALMLIQHVLSMLADLLRWGTDADPFESAQF